MAYLPLIACGLWLIMAGATYAQTCNNPAGLTGRGQMSDWDAAAAVKPTARSIIEKNALGTASINAAANSYYYYHGQSAYYNNQLAGFHAAWKGDSVMQRVDGKCPLGPDPTTAEINQWAAHKWGFSPLISYAEPTNDGKWDMNSLGDGGCSVGENQIAFCNDATHPHHAIQGLNTGQPGHLLPKENTCFNADLFAAFLYKHYTNGRDCGYRNIVKAIQEWTGSCVTNKYGTAMCHSLATHDWDTRFFDGDPVPY